MNPGRTRVSSLMRRLIELIHLPITNDTRVEIWRHCRTFETVASALTVRLSLFLSLANSLLFVSANNYTLSLPAHQAIECPVLSKGANPCGDSYIASYCACCKNGYGGCATPEVFEAKRVRRVRLFQPTSVTVPGGADTDTGACADTGQVDCGAGCMPAAETCCPDQSCYCPVSVKCWFGY